MHLGELLTIYLEVTLPALHQEAVTSRERVDEKARQAKAKAYPRKDSSGRLLNESFCILVILTSMGGSVMKDTISFVCAKCATKVPLFIF